MDKDANNQEEQKEEETALEVIADADKEEVGMGAGMEHRTGMDKEVLKVGAASEEEVEVALEARGSRALEQIVPAPAVVQLPHEGTAIQLPLEGTVIDGIQMGKGMKKQRKGKKQRAKKRAERNKTQERNGGEDLKSFQFDLWEGCQKSMERSILNRDAKASRDWMHVPNNWICLDKMDHSIRRERGNVYHHRISTMCS
jgi:hypothetical protein